MTNALRQQPLTANAGARRSAIDFAVNVTTEGDVRVAWLSGELDWAASPWLAEALADTIGTWRQHLVLDLSNLDFVDAAGLGAIVRARNTMWSHAGDLTVRAPSPFAARVIEVAGLEGLLSHPPTGRHGTNLPPEG